MRVDDALRCLTEAHRAGRLAQAYVIEGPLRGEGMELAMRLLALLFCEAPDAPCGKCRGCRHVADRTHADILWVEPEKKSRQISVDQVRGVRSRICQASFQGGWKAAVIVGADRLNPNAGNAFLKVLEEPPGRSLLLLLSEAPQFLLPTILSRCQRLAVGGEALDLPDAWRECLVGLLADGPDDDIGGSRIMAAERQTARLGALLKEVMQTARELEGALAEEASTEESDETLEARVASRYRELRAGVLRALLGWHRDVMVLLCGGAPSLLYFPDQLEILTARAGALTYRQALANVVAVETLNRKLEQNLPEGLVLQDLFHRLR